MSRQGPWVAIVALLLPAVACTPPHPVDALRPRYPAILQSAEVTGFALAMVRVDRHGRAVVVRRESDTTVAAQLWALSVRQAVQATAWRPARRLGVAHADSVTYRVDFVLVRDTTRRQLPIESEWAPDTLSPTCPRPQHAHAVVVCGAVARRYWRRLP